MTEQEPGALLAAAQVGFFMVFAGGALALVGATAAATVFGVAGMLIVALPLLVPVAVIVLFAMAVARGAEDPEQDEWAGPARDPRLRPSRERRDYRTFDPSDLDLDVATIHDMRRR